jgi:hypothetical protein
VYYKLVGREVFKAAAEKYFRLQKAAPIGGNTLRSTWLLSPEVVVNERTMKLALLQRELLDEPIADAQISTIFLGVGHNYYKEGAPVLFETMLFGDALAGRDQRRYCTYEEALAGHQEYLQELLSLGWVVHEDERPREQLEKGNVP